MHSAREDQGEKKMTTLIYVGHTSYSCHAIMLTLLSDMQSVISPIGPKHKKSQTYKFNY
jgi:hypothetical protein